MPADMTVDSLTGMPAFRNRADTEQPEGRRALRRSRFILHQALKLILHMAARPSLARAALRAPARTSYPSSAFHHRPG